MKKRLIAVAVCMLSFLIVGNSQARTIQSIMRKIEKSTKRVYELEDDIKRMEDKKKADPQKWSELDQKVLRIKYTNINIYKCTLDKAKKELIDTRDKFMILFHLAFENFIQGKRNQALKYCEQAFKIDPESEKVDELLDDILQSE